MEGGFFPEHRLPSTHGDALATRRVRRRRLSGEGQMQHAACSLEHCRVWLGACPSPYTLQSEGERQLIPPSDFHELVDGWGQRLTLAGS
jgi:hypothetical protein